MSWTQTLRQLRKKKKKYNYDEPEEQPNVMRESMCLPLGWCGEHYKDPAMHFFHLAHPATCVNKLLKFLDEPARDYIIRLCADFAEKNKEKPGLSFQEAFFLAIYTHDLNHSDKSKNFYFGLNNHLLNYDPLESLR
eukprot:TRINITY_DN1754_c0_g1_i2.p2 TRINITY_DN1754_c0_g1~~TRINITY_DN1754_c0_g1_i2.p2  ORF type:complete len:136 (-),score=14.90 TRINITY_DN1754_c0_g1_i2:1157-1564(-)